MRVYRAALVFWLGACVMFLCLLIGLRRAGSFSDEIKQDQLLVLFPIYYQLQAVVLGLAGAAWLGHVFHRRNPTEDSRKPGRFVGTWLLHGLTAILLVSAVIDYVCIYQPLEAMMRERTLTASFRGLHRISIALNALQMLSIPVLLWLSRSRPCTRLKANETVAELK